MISYILFLANQMVQYRSQGVKEEPGQGSKHSNSDAFAMFMRVVHINSQRLLDRIEKHGMVN